MTTNKNFAQMSSKKLRELMQHAEPEDAKAIEELLKARGRLDEKFIIIKTIGKYDSYVVRELDDEESAKLFVSLLRESEQHDFIRYRITKVINY